MDQEWCGWSITKCIVWNARMVSRKKHHETMIHPWTKANHARQILAASLTLAILLVCPLPPFRPPKKHLRVSGIPFSVKVRFRQQIRGPSPDQNMTCLDVGNWLAVHHYKDFPGFPIPEVHSHRIIIREQMSNSDRGKPQFRYQCPEFLHLLVGRF